MTLDPEILKQLITIFKTELEEQLQVITDGLLVLEKGTQDSDNKKKTIETIFRAGHNIKGSSRGLGIQEVGEISHYIESIFSAIQKEELSISKKIIDLCLEAVDKMREAMTSFVSKKPLSFDLPAFIALLEKAVNSTDTSVLSPEPANLKTNKTSTKSRKNVPQEKDSVKPISPTKETAIKPNQVGVSDNLLFTEMHTNETIRVSIDKIDKVSALMEEIQVNKIAIDDYYTEFTQLYDKTKDFMQLWKHIYTSLKNNLNKEVGDNLHKLCHSGNDFITDISHTTSRLHKNMRNQASELATISNSLQEEIRMLRLVPASNLLCTLPRYVRDLSQDLNKKVELEIKGDEVKVDKIVLEGLKDPINHILRNAIDHGVESSEARKELGKPETAHIKIDIKDEGNYIIITIKDDGGGINVKKIAAHAERLNLATHAELETMSENDIIDFIFRPGFSTKEIITNVSGRGVGLDVVKANILDLKGQVTITTELNVGTTFSLRVPLMLSSERGLMVNSAGQLFVIPTHAVERVCHVQSTDIIEIEGGQAVILNKHPIPLHTLSDMLDIPQAESPTVSTHFPIVMIKKGWHAIAVLVNEIIGEREIVVKPLQPPLTHIPCVSGGTLLERSQVVVVLNPSDLIDKALHLTTVHRVMSHTVSDNPVERHHILVVDDSITTRTLEKNVLEAKNYAVTVAVNGKEAWDILQKKKFSLLITDVNMPIMDGFTLTELVKQNEKLRNMPVVIVTSLGSDAEKAHGISVGANAYIVKSEFESGTLLEIVEQLVI